MKNFSRDEILDGDERRTCDHCEETTVTHKTVYIWEPPEILFIHLKRFGVKKVYNIHMKQYVYTGYKISTPITFPLQGLTLNDNYSPIKQSDNIYDLIGVVQHSGAYDAGHYISCVKHPINGEWYRFNDLNRYIRHISQEKLKDNIITPDAYLLIYVRKKIDKDKLICAL